MNNNKFNTFFHSINYNKCKIIHAFYSTLISLGWSVTVAGNCCHSEMAPDVEMRLCFPNQVKYESHKSIKNTINGSYAQHNQSHDNDDVFDDDVYERYQQQRGTSVPPRNGNYAALPDANTDLDKPKRSLMKANG